MMVRVVAAAEYYAAFPVCRNLYGSQAFIEVVKDKAQAVRHFIAVDEDFKPRFGVILGYRDGRWMAPFSAPFTEIAYNKSQHLERIYDFISELTTMLDAPLSITLPPDFYDPEMLPKFAGILGNYADRATVDFNYSYPLDRIGRYEAMLDHSARKNLARANAAGFRFETTTDVARAYNIIKANREHHRYPLAMSLEQVTATVAKVRADFFVMSLGSVDVAAAMVYHVAPGIVQVVYWGDAPGHSEMRPMNLFAYKLFQHYAQQGLHIVDVGPSSSRGIPSTGLCRFKESVGCVVTLKPSFEFK